MDHPHQSTDKNVVIQDTNPPNASASTGATKEPSYLDWSLINRLKIKLNIFGFSYHTDRKGTRECHVDNEFNIGVGFDYKLHDDATGVLGSSVGIYRDSGRNWAKLAGVNYLFKLGDRSKFGADLLLVKSPTYNYGRSLVALIPRLAYDFGPVELNAIYIPKYRDVNQFAVFGIYFSIPLWP